MHAPTLPTPCARDGRGVGHQYGLPDLIEPGGTRHHLLPTPTAVPYGTTQSPSPGTAIRPSLDSLARAQLSPAPRAGSGTDPIDGSNRNMVWRPTPETAVHGDETARSGKPSQPRRLPTPAVAGSRSPADATAGRTLPPSGHASRTLTDAARLLPTPRATDGSKGCPGQRGSHGDLTLPAAAVRFLPTPRASDGHGASDHGGGGADLPTAVAGTHTETVGRMAAEPSVELGQPDDQRWGEYATAVTRWEVLLGRRAPEPSQPGRHGKPVLAPSFVEWLMGLPELWVTHPQLRLPRTRALRVLGNGVVPQQAAAALCLLLDPDRWAAP